MASWTLNLPEFCPSLANADTFSVSLPNSLWMNYSWTRSKTPPFLPCPVIEGLAHAGGFNYRLLATDEFCLCFSIPNPSYERHTDALLDKPIKWYKCSSNSCLENQTIFFSLLNVSRLFCICPGQVALVMSDSLRPHGPGSSVHGDSPGKKTGVGCHVLHQGIFLTQGLNPHLLQFLHCRRVLYC